LLEEGAHTYSGGLRLYRLGHRNMIDNILYASSVMNPLSTVSASTRIL
jgi:hypothetical protein